MSAPSGAPMGAARRLAAPLALGWATLLALGCAAPPRHDLVIRGGQIYDGLGGVPYVGDVAVDGDRITRMGDLGEAIGRVEIDAAGLAVAPGFINMLSWATVSLIEDGRGMSDLLQGVTLEVFGEGWSMGPLNDEMKRKTLERQADIRFDVSWTSLGEYLDHLVARGISPNVASFVGASTVRIHEIGYEDRAAAPEELERMRALVAGAMEEGALGVGSSLIYAPASFADTAELVALAEVAAAHGGMYISHLRSEGDELFEALDELLIIARRAGVPAEVYHLKASRPENWWKLEEAISRIEAARAEGLKITADIYTYPASSTGLDAVMPLWVQEGGHDAWVERLRDPEIRARVAAEMTLLPPGKTLLVGFRSEALKPLAGSTLAEVAATRGATREEAAMDLVVEDDSRIGVVYFSMSEENVRRKVALPWVSFCSDAGALAAEGVFLASSTHPRAYGSFARLLGRYVRDEGAVPLEEAVRRLTSLPADNLKIRDRGRLEEGRFADVVVFEPQRIADRATFAEPHQYAVGVAHVLVNGVQVVRDGEHTGALPGRVVRGPGYTGEAG